MSLAVIGNLRATLGLDSAQFNAGIKSARSALGTLKYALAGFGTGIAASMVFDATVGALREIAEMGDLAKNIGITAEQVQVFNRMALASGASTDVMARGLQSITEQSTQAGSALGKLFEANGFTAKTMDANQAILTFMDLLQRARTPAEQLQMATSVLGDKVGRQLVESMRTGAAGFDDAMRDMVQSGIYHTDAEVARIQDLEERYNEAAAAITTVWQKMIVGLVEGVDVARGFFAEVDARIEKNQKAYDRDELPSIFDWLTGRTPLKPAPTSAPGKGDLPNSAPVSVLPPDKPPKPPKPVIDPDEARRIEELRQSLDELASMGRRVFDETRTPLENYTARIRELDVLLAEGAINQETYNRAMSQARYQFAATEEAAENLGQTVADYLTDVFSNWADSAIDGTFKLKDALGELARELAKGTFRNLLASILGGGGNTASGGLFGSLLGGLFGGGFAGLYANGGKIGPGQWGITGEAGPEVVTGPASITPLKNLAGSSEVHIVLHPTDELWAKVDNKVMAGSRRAVQVSVAESGRNAQRSFGSTYRDNQVRKF